MSAAPLTGQLVHLKTFDFEKDAQAWAAWSRDTEYQRLLDSGPARLQTAASVRDWMERDLGKDFIVFSIYPLEGEEAVGFICLDGFDWLARSAWVSIGIGDSASRGRGLGTDAMRVLSRFAFEQLNLNRINLDVFEYNPRAIHSYEKCGFVHEGCQRQFLNREGRRWDLIYMGLLKEDWLKNQK